MKTLLNSMILLTSMNDRLMPFGESRGAFFHPQIALSLPRSLVDALGASGV